MEFHVYECPRTCYLLQGQTKLYSDWISNHNFTKDTQMSIDQNQCKTMSVPECGKLYFDIGKNASYEAAKRGDIPTIKIGGKLRVPIVAAERKLEEV